MSAAGWNKYRLQYLLEILKAYRQENKKKIKLFNNKGRETKRGDKTS